MSSNRGGPATLNWVAERDRGAEGNTRRGSTMTHMPGRGKLAADWVRDSGDPMKTRALGRELGYLAQCEQEQRLGQFYSRKEAVRPAPVRVLTREEIEAEYGQ